MERIDASRTCSNQSTWATAMPTNAYWAMNATRLAMANDGLRNRGSCSIGEALRLSAAANAITATTVTMKATMIRVEVKPSLPPSITP